jgi:hypothetical protein
VFQEQGLAFCTDLFAGGKEAKVEVFVTVRERCAAVETARTHRDEAGRAEDARSRREVRVGGEGGGATYPQCLA